MSEPLVIDIPRKARDTLLPTHTPDGVRVRFRVLYGGRDGGKSHSIARVLLARGMARCERVLCVREVQNSIADSVHKLLSDLIASMDLGWFYTVQKTTILGVNGTEFLFHGLSTETRDSLKSKEGTTLCWVEEAQTITKRSWEILEPTIRVKDSEIIVSFNPHMDTDETWLRFVASPPSDAIVTNINWDDNPWRSEVLDAAREKMKRESPEDYDNIYGGKPRATVAGAIYRHELPQAVADKRIRPVPYDPMLKVHTVWDLGWNDQMTVICCQRLRSEVRVIDYLEDSHRVLADYVAELEKKRYRWGNDWLPHDAEHKDFKYGTDAVDIFRRLGRSPLVVPNVGVEQGIRVARQVFPRVYFDETKAARLIECLKRYRRHIPVNTDEDAKPLHDEYSHGADAFRYMALVVDRMDNEASTQIKYPKTGVV